MQLRFLGTSAAGGFPNPHCACENCLAARAEGGKSIRFQSSAMIDDDLIIDFGPDLLGAAMRHCVDFTTVHWALQTHPHHDHLLPLHAVARSASWAAQRVPPLTWFGAEATVHAVVDNLGKSASKMDMAIDDPERAAKLHFITITPWQELRFGPYLVQTIAANHDPSVNPMLFAIERDGRRLLYGTDTTSLSDDTWPRLAELGWTFDVVVFDHNDGHMRPVSHTHMGSEGMRAEVARMRDFGMVSDATRVIGTHLGHHSHGPHSIEAAKAEALGYEIAFDGMTVSV